MTLFQYRMVLLLTGAFIAALFGASNAVQPSETSSISLSRIDVMRLTERSDLGNEFARMIGSGYFPAAARMQEQQQEFERDTGGPGGIQDSAAADSALLPLLPVDAVVAYVAQGGGEWTAIFSSPEEMHASLREAELADAGWQIEERGATRVVLVKNGRRVVFDAFSPSAEE